MIIQMTRDQASTASSIQAAIDSLGPQGGTVVLPEGEFLLDRGLELHPDVCLEGKGQNTLLRKAPGRVYPLAGYHNYGMMDVPLVHTKGLEPGMTVAIRDDVRRGCNETLARITWVDDGWVGLDRGIESDYYEQANAALVTAYPLVFGRGSHGAALRNLCLDGAKETQEAGIGTCRGAAIYFYQADGVVMENVLERSFMGDGTVLLMCSHITLRQCAFNENTGNGFHPGAGSTNALFEDCAASDNGGSGFFFCVRANHITVQHCDFERNGKEGVSIGKRDCNNLIKDCRILNNGGPGVGFRGEPRPVEEHSVRVERCDIGNNCQTEGMGQVVLGQTTHDVTLINNCISGATAGVYANEGAERIYLQNNAFEGVTSERRGSSAAWTEQEPAFAYGHDAATDRELRHLAAYLRRQYENQTDA